MNRSIQTLLPGLAALACVLSVSAPAAALDGYEDRRGIFAGAGIGGGVGLVNTDLNSETTGVDRGRKLGLHLNGALGGGVTRDLTVYGDVNWWARTVYINEDELELAHHHLSFNAVSQYFLFRGFFLEGGGGLAYAIFDTSRDGGAETFRYQELGLALKGGAGFEFFLNGQIAAGFRMGYTRHFYGGSDFDTIAGGVTLRWY